LKKKDYGDIALGFGAGMGLAALVTLVYATATKNQTSGSVTPQTLLQAAVPTAVGTLI
jgi:hypothetical protein